MSADKAPKVGVIMGSTSDWPVMQAAARVLADFEVPYETDIVSAHRTPQKLYEYAGSAKRRGLMVIIAGAGGAAHLPGMTAAMTPLPVVGVPVNATALNGNDALLSIAQMPRGIPVATVAIDNAHNAGLLAVQIVATSDPALSDRVEAYRDQLRREVEERAKAASFELE